MDLIAYMFGDVDRSKLQPIDHQRALQHAALNVPNAPCGCPACDDGVQPGHFACSTAPEWVLMAEREGAVVRYYNGTSWVWEAV